MNHAVNIFDRETRAPIATEINFEPLSWTSNIDGGPKTAEVRGWGSVDALVDAFTWLGKILWIYDENGEPCWWGFIESVELNGVGVGVGLTLESMYNAVAVQYTIAGETETQRTNWSEDLYSVNLYERKELMYSAGELSIPRALELQSTLLTRFAHPTRYLTPSDTQPAPEIRIRCLGEWAKLDWRYYDRPDGKSVFEEGGNYIPFGFEIYSNEMAVYGPVLADYQERLGNIPEGTYLFVTGTVLQDGDTVKVTKKAEAKGERVVISSTGVSFEPADDVLGADIDKLKANNIIRITGATNGSNNGYFLINTYHPDETPQRIEVNNKTIVTEAAGNTITIEQGHYVEVEKQWKREIAASYLTVRTAAILLAQRVEIPAGLGWDVARIGILAKRIGNPTDTLRIDIYTDSGGSIGSFNSYTEIQPGDIPDTGRGWVFGEYSVGSRLSVAGGGAFWFLIWRTGARSADHYYEIELADNTEYDGTRLWYSPDAVSYYEWWGDQPVAIPFRVYSAERADVQLSTMISQISSLGVAGTTLASAPESNPWRDGSGTGKTEIEQMKQSGIYGNVTRDRRVVVWQSLENDEPSNWLELRPDGRLYENNQPIPAGQTPVNRWVKLTFPFVLPGVLGEPFLIEECTYNPQQGGWSITPYGAPTPYEIADFLVNG